MDTGFWRCCQPLADQLADQRAPVLTGFGLQIGKTLLGLGIQPDGEWHDGSRQGRTTS